MSPRTESTEPPSPGAGPWAGRTAERAAIDAALGAAADGAGGVIHIEAAAGLGKTRLLDAAADAGRRAGAQVLRAEGRSAERGYRFGVAVQLFEPSWLALGADDRAELERGPARAVAQLMAGDHAGAEEFAVVHGLLWLARSLTNAGATLLLAVDDLDRADDPSLAALAYLGARIDGLPILLTTAGRVVPPAADGTALAALREQATVLRPSPLSLESVAAIVSAELPDADAALHATCAELTAGNPQLLNGLLDDLRGQDPLPAPEALAQSPPDSAQRLARSILDGLDPAARDLAHAVAAREADPELRTVVSSAGLTIQDGARAADALIAAGVLAHGEPLRFTAPLLHGALRVMVPRTQPGVTPAGGRPNRRVAALVASDALESALEVLAGREQQDAARADPELAAAHARSRAWALWHQGAIPEALAAAHDVREDRERDVSGLAGVIAACHLELGQVDQANTALEVLRTPERVPGVEIPVLLVVRAQVRLVEGRAGDALVDALEAGRWAPSPVGDARSAVVSWRLAASLARLAMGQAAEARHLADEEMERARDGEITRLMIGCQRVLGLAAEGRRRTDMLAEAVSIGGEHPRRLEYLRALIDLGAATRRANRRAAAQVPLTRAVELSQEWGAVALGRQAQTELAACGARRVGNQDGGREALTPSERRVATLAASGHTTRQIAAELFVTAKTVEFHLRHVYRKLGIPSTRADLAAALSGNDPHTAGNG